MPSVQVRSSEKALDLDPEKKRCKRGIKLQNLLRTLNILSTNKLLVVSIGSGAIMNNLPGFWADNLFEKVANTSLLVDDST